MNGLVFWIGIFGIVVSILGCLHLSAYAESATYPIGIVANGEDYQKVPTIPYEINTSGILGLAQISSVGVNPPNSGSSLQLNAMLHVITTNGTVDYWLQNVVHFPNSNFNDIQILNNVWSTSTNSKMIACVLTTPLMSGELDCNKPYPGFGYVTNANGYSAPNPLHIGLALSEQTMSGQGVKIQFEYITPNGTRLYDNREIQISGTVSSTFLITSSSNIRNWMYYDAELVWAGLCCGQTANFTSMDSSLGLYYYDDNVQTPQGSSQPYSVNPWKVFPSYTTYGRDTAETSQNIYSTIEANSGQALVKLGSPLSILTDKQSYTKGDVIRIYGQISNVVPSLPLTITVLDPYNNVVQTYQANIQPLIGPHVDNSTVFDDYIQTGDNPWKYGGVYTIEADYGSSPPIQTTFNLNMSPQPTVQPTPQTVNPSYPSFLSITSTYVLDNNDINYGLPNGKIVNMELLPGSKSISIETKSTETSPLGIDLPESLIKFNADPQIFVDGIQTSYSYKVKTLDGIALSIGVPSGDHKIEIISSQATVPEFGSLALIVFLIGIVSTLAISSKLGSEIT